MLGQTAREFFSRDYPLDRIRDIYRSDEGYDPALWTGMQGLGWTTAPFPEEMGGTGGGLLDSALIVEEMGKGCAATPYVHSTVAAGLALVEADAELANAIANGDATVIPAMTAQVSGNGSISGSAVAVPFAAQATHFLVPLGDDSQMAVVEASATSISQLPTAGGELLYEVTFDGSAARTVSEDGLQQKVITLGAVGNSLFMLGLCQRTLELSSDYAKERVAFGKPIGAFQAISHKCSNMVVDIEVGRYLTYKAAWLHGMGRDFQTAARYAKAFMGDATARVTRDGIQVHGGVGFIDDHNVQFPYRLGMGAASAYGTSHEHRRVIADAVLG